MCTPVYNSSRLFIFASKRAIGLKLTFGSSVHFQCEHSYKSAAKMVNSKESVELQLRSIENQIESIDSQILKLSSSKQRLIIEKETLQKHLNEIELDNLSKSVNWASETEFPWSSDMNTHLQKSFNLSQFRPCQVSAINAFLSGHDVIVIMPTGGGKSLCYQLAAITKNKGFTLVVSPLVSLMEDQVMSLRKLNINVGQLSAGSEKEEVNRIHDEMLKKGTSLRLLYVTPERLAKSKRFMAKLQKAYNIGNFTQLAVDEVHCCSQWGHDFRPDYKYLGVMKNLFPDIAIMGLTATITSTVCDDVKNILNMGQTSPCLQFKASFNRPNLYYEVRQKPETQEETISVLHSMLTREFCDESGIIYTLSIKDAESISSELRNRGVKCGPYHASLDPNMRSKVHRKWLSGDYQVVVATIAFGMGIDKPDVRFVIHHSLSKSMENFYQESGRAGRDDRPATCILFYRLADVFRLSTMVFSDKTGLSKLYEMMAYCNSNTARCRRQIISDHFDENWESTDCNKMCDNCKHRDDAEMKHVQELNVKEWVDAVIKILNQAKSGDVRVTANKLVDALLGKGQANLKLNGWKAPLPPKHIFSSNTRYLAEAIVCNLLLEGHLKEDFHFTPYSTISYILVNRSKLPDRYEIPIPVMLSHNVQKAKKRALKEMENEPKQDERRNI